MLMLKDDSFLRAALVGYEAQLQQVQAKIAEIQKRLGGSKATAGVAGTSVARPRRTMSAAARKSIADAQKRRWAAYRAQQG